jgi:hypothetical protein
MFMDVDLFEVIIRIALMGGHKRVTIFTPAASP